MITNSYCGSIWHHGIKGQKWGVRRTPEELGHFCKNRVEKSEGKVILDNGKYKSSKGFSIDENKLRNYLLKAGTQHYEEFRSLGYTKENPDRLVSDIHSAFNITKMISESVKRNGKRRFSIPMNLGIESTATVRSVWEVGPDDSTYRFITAYIDRRLKEHD